MILHRCGRHSRSCSVVGHVDRMSLCCMKWIPYAVSVTSVPTQMYNYHWIGLVTSSSLHSALQFRVLLLRYLWCHILILSILQLSILFLRAKFVFHETELQLSGRYNRNAVTCICVLLLWYTAVCLLMFLRIIPFSTALLLASLWIFLMLIFSQFLAFTFVRKLFVLNALAERDDELIASMTR